MTHFMVRWRFTSAAVRFMVDRPENRTAQARALIESYSGKLHHYYFSFGEFDGLAICEFPDAGSAAAASLTATSSGAFSRFETTALLTGAEAEAAMRRAHDTKTGYKPPIA